MCRCEMLKTAFSGVLCSKNSGCNLVSTDHVYSSKTWIQSCPKWREGPSINLAGGAEPAASHSGRAFLFLDHSRPCVPQCPPFVSWFWQSSGQFCDVILELFKEAQTLIFVSIEFLLNAFSAEIPTAVSGSCELDPDWCWYFHKMIQW